MVGHHLYAPLLLASPNMGMPQPKKGAHLKEPIVGSLGKFAVCLVFLHFKTYPVLCSLDQTQKNSSCSRFIVRIMFSVLGMHVRQNSPRLRDKSTKLYICNHVTQFDHNIVNLLTSCNTVSILVDEVKLFIVLHFELLELCLPNRTKISV